ncbi:hypothetical protein BofuT4_P034870.1 [Botrytis cinerea T4]|uniref:Uncharacterized protein n=1 Tax=Botryotinia fuckeliana (strain T4) TaxID=999810 RepID=G2Y6E2_BOTF4|nr:hypothetical protein BofuT4_P034870.1 [Botrytis cinerea T4]
MLLLGFYRCRIYANVCADNLHSDINLYYNKRLPRGAFIFNTNYRKSPTLNEVGGPSQSITRSRQLLGLDSGDSWDHPRPSCTLFVFGRFSKFRSRRGNRARLFGPKRTYL